MIDSNILNYSKGISLIESSRKRELIITLTVLLVMVLIVGGASALKKESSKHVTSTPVAAKPTPKAAANTVTATPSTTPAVAGSMYKNGTYMTTASYDSPGGVESIVISITLQDDIVTDTSARSESNSDDSRQYQEVFIESYKPLVVGKKINTISLNRVSGASLTSRGFNSALKQIESQAQA